jgi:hypothetical protein
MRFRRLLCIPCFGCACLLSGCTGPGSDLAVTASAEVDFVEYLLQTDDPDQRWILSGFDTGEIPDPDGVGGATYALSKFSDPAAFEVFRVTDTQIQLRYEVYKSTWIRRFEEADGEGDAPGCVWMQRRVVPGSPPFLSRFSQDRFVYDSGSGSYQWDRAGSGRSFGCYISADWVSIDWGDRNRTGFDLERVLRVTSEWQDLGLVYETYDYVRGKGLVNWRWLESLDAHVRHKPWEGDPSGRVFRCENGLVEVQSYGSAGCEPVVFLYDAETRSRGRQLEVVQRTSSWRPEQGPGWYVVYRDLSKEYNAELRKGSVTPTSDLPLWGPNRSLIDLPYGYTRPPGSFGEAVYVNGRPADDSRSRSE